MKKATAFLVVVPLFAGCALGPAHLPMLYDQRDYYQKLITDVETRHHLSPRRSDQEEAVKDLRRQVDDLRATNQRLIEEKDRMREESQDIQWFRSLPPQEQVQWRMHRDAVKAGRVGEYQNAPRTGGPRPGPVNDTPSGLQPDEEGSFDETPVDPADLPGQPDQR